MDLEFSYDAAEDIPEGLGEYYTEKGGKQALNIKGAAPADQVVRLETSLTKERNSHKDTKATLSAFGELNPEETLAALDSIEEMKAQIEAGAGGKLDEDALDKLVEQRIKRQIAPMERAAQKSADTITGLTTELSEHKTAASRRQILDAVTKAVDKAEVSKDARDDAVFLGQHTFEIDESGEVVTKEGGLTPAGYTPELWMTEIQPHKAHWWAKSTGAGAGGSGAGAGAGSASNPWSKAGWNMTKQSAMVANDPLGADKMAKAAGSSVGAIAPKE